MCGFIGIITKEHHPHAKLTKCAADIAARGTHHTTFTHPNESYAYARLPTDGVTHPINDDLSKTTPFLLFNGLLTNTSQLAQRFQLSSRAATADHYCLKEGLEKHNRDFLSRCEGMFAAAFVTEQKVILIRDTIGIKPLYFIHTPELFAFASEIKALRHLHSDIHELTPGTILHFDKPTHTCRSEAFTYTSEQPPELEVSLKNAVILPTQRYLAQSGKNLAVLLSGGVDSSLIGQLLATHLAPAEKQRIRAFCIGHPDAPDVRAAKKLAEHLDFPPLTHLQPHDDHIALSHLSDIVYHSESPYARVTKVALLYDQLARAIKQAGIDVVLGGEGADEHFFGYHRFIDGLTDQQTAQCFDTFTTRIFPTTLLQRYDRMFARHQIEGRVPFLNQAVISAAAAIPPHEKIKRHSTGHTSKLPLRTLAQKLGLPAYITHRPKEKMTAGATGQTNTSSTDGYLEQSTLKLYGRPFSQLVQQYYMEHFPIRVHRHMNLTEEALMHQVNTYKSHNHVKGAAHVH